MEWFKVKVKHSDYDFINVPAEVFKAWILLMSFCAATERKPTREEMEIRVGKKNFLAVCQVLEKYGATIDHVMDKILEDVVVVKNRRAHDKEYRCRTRQSGSNVHDIVACADGKRREEKRREEYVPKGTKTKGKCCFCGKPVDNFGVICNACEKDKTAINSEVQKDHPGKIL